MSVNCDALLGSGLFFADQPVAAEAAGFANQANCILVISTVIVVALLVAVAAASRSKIGLVSTGMGTVFEIAYEFVADMAISMMGPVGKRFVPFCMSIFLFVLLSNWSGLLPFPALASLAHGEEHGYVFEAPTTQFSTTFAMAVVSFVAVIFFGMRKYMFGAEEQTEEDPDEQDPALKDVMSEEENRSEHHHSHGDGPIKGFFTWWTHYLHPTPMLWHDMQGIMRYLLVPVLGCLFIVLNIIEELARLVSLSIRLYGNLHGEHVVKSNLVSTMQDFVNQALGGGMAAFIGYLIMAVLMWGCSFFVTCIGTLAGFIQAYVFFVLTLSYISHVATDEH